MQVRIARELLGRCRSLTRTILELDRELQARTQTTRAGAARAARLRRLERRQAALRDRPDRPLPHRRPARPPRRRRTTRRQLRQTPTPPTRPRRQPPTQLRPPPDRDHPRPRPPTRTRLPRTQTERRQEPPRSHPLPQTTTRPHRLHHPQKRAALDIGATLAHTSVPSPTATCRLKSCAGSFLAATTRGALNGRFDVVSSEPRQRWASDPNRTARRLLGSLRRRPSHSGLQASRAARRSPTRSTSSSRSTTSCSAQGARAGCAPLLRHSAMSRSSSGPT